MSHKEALLLVLEPIEEKQKAVKSALECARLSARQVFVETSEDVINYLYGKPPYQDKREFPPPGLILLAQKLGSPENYQLLKALKKDGVSSHIPIVVMSRRVTDVQLEKAYSLGVNSVIRDPLNRAALMSVLRVFDRYWFESVSLP